MGAVGFPNRRQASALWPRPFATAATRWVAAINLSLVPRALGRGVPRRPPADLQSAAAEISSLLGASVR